MILLRLARFNAEKRATWNKFLETASRKDGIQTGANASF